MFSYLYSPYKIALNGCDYAISFIFQENILLLTIYYLLIFQWLKFRFHISVLTFRGGGKLIDGFLRTNVDTTHALFAGFKPFGFAVYHLNTARGTGLCANTATVTAWIKLEHAFKSKKTKIPEHTIYDV